jgi:hypothetical protein
MSQLTREATLLTNAARLDGAGGVPLTEGAITDQKLRKPEGESLFAHAGRAVEQQALGQGTTRSGRREARPQYFVSVERNERHRGQIYRCGRATAR